ncbi:hypothetical protein, partial [Bacillus anthracis]|uniref:hypothetical protein n=1 Tax=Bacillus anthracis TaxID=1392 RepID=UPI003F6E0D8A
NITMVLTLKIFLISYTVISMIICGNVMDGGKKKIKQRNVIKTTFYQILLPPFFWTPLNGRAAGWGRGENSGGAGSLKKKKKKKKIKKK